MIREILPYLAKAILHFIKYFVFPMFVSCSILLIIGLVVSLVLTFPQVDISSSFIISLLLGFMASLMIFVIKTIDKVFGFLWANRKLKSYMEHRLPKVKHISIRTRLLLKTYLFWLFVATASLCLSFFLIAYSDTRSEVQPPIYSINFLIGMVFYFCMAFFWIGYRSIYKEKERTVYLLDKFSEDISIYLSNDDVKPNVNRFEEALKSYQRVLPTSFVIKDLKKRVMQTVLVLDRGSRKEIEGLQSLFRKTSVSIQEEDRRSVDQHFKKMIELLEKVQADKREILELATSRREKAKASIREIARIILHRVIPTLIIIVMLLAIYMLLGIKLDFLA